MSDVQLHLGDCLEVMASLPDKSLDAIITDLPYGNTKCKWDAVIPIEFMWKEVNRVLKPKRAFVTTALQPFASRLIMSNIEDFRHDWVWSKKVGANFQKANQMPMRSHELILVFGRGGVYYNPQKTQRETPKDYRNCNYGILGKSDRGLNHFDSADVTRLNIVRTDKFPLSVLEYSAQAKECNNVNRLHPMQKPVSLYEYLILTYTDESDTVGDFVMGSGTTGVAAVNTGRNFVGCDNDADYFAVAQKRILEARQKLEKAVVQ